jgi:hypothetical protein
MAAGPPASVLVAAIDPSTQEAINTDRFDKQLTTPFILSVYGNPEGNTQA